VLIEPIVRGSDEDNGLVWQLLATQIRGKCTVVILNEVETYDM
jgi:hypothetical protein